MQRMKNILFLTGVILVTLWSCGKEENIHPDMKPGNLYEIKDNPSDSIQHKVYEIYKNYGVSVFFNDTIGKVFVKADIKGDSIFCYECLDPAWSFTGNDGLSYEYTYMTDPGEQSRFLNVIGQFLQKSSKTLYPYSVLIVNDYKTINARDEEEISLNGSFKVFYKLLLLTGDENTNLEGKPDEIIRRIIENRITDYKDLLSAFNRISKEYLGKRDWATLGIDKLTIPVEFEEYDYWGNWVTTVVDEFSDSPIYGGVGCLEDGWWGFRDYSVEIVEKLRISVREEIGKFGFTGQSLVSYSAPPKDEEDDLKVFVKEVLRYSQSDFKKLWGNYPLVMQKYEILAGIIVDELGIEL